MIKDFLRRFFIDELDEAYDQGEGFGSRRGFATGYDIGKNTGISLGKGEGWARGYWEGCEDGRELGYDKALKDHNPDNYEAIGYAKGYEDGFAAGLSDQPVDFPFQQDENVAYVSNRDLGDETIDAVPVAEFVEDDNDCDCDGCVAMVAVEGEQIDNKSFCQGALEMGRMVREILKSAHIDDQAVLVSVSIAEEALCFFLGETVG